MLCLFFLASVSVRAADSPAFCITCEVQASKLGESRYPKLNGDGSIVVFQSTARLAEQDKDKNSDVYVWEKSTRKSRRLRGFNSVRRNGGPSISADGKTVVFHSYPPKPRDPNQTTPADIVLWNLNASTFTILTKPASGQAHDGEAVFPLINKDAQWVLFSSNDSNLLTDKPYAVRSIYLYNLSSPGLVSVTKTPQGDWANRASGDPRMSDDSRYILFRSAATNLCGDLPETSLANHLYYVDRFQNEMIRIDEKERGLDPALWAVGAADMDAEGRTIVLEARDRKAGDHYSYLKLTDLFFYDVAEGKVRPLGLEQFRGRTKNPALSADGRFAVFIIRASESEEGSVVIYDRTTNAWKTGGTSTCLHPDISDDGSMVAFECEQRGGRKRVRHIYLMKNPFYARH